LRRNCLLRHFIDRKIGGSGRRGRKHTQLLDDLKATKRQWKLKEDTLNRTAWRTALEHALEIVARPSVIMKIIVTTTTTMMMMMMMQSIFLVSEGTDILGLAECYSQFLYGVLYIVF